MPDAYGRPTMSDGLAAFQGLRVVEADQDRRAAAAADKQAYTAAEILKQGGDVSKFDPEVKYKGAELHWNSLLNENKAKTQELITSQAGMQEKMSKIDLNNKVLQQRFNQVNALIKSGQTDKAMKLMAQTNNENMYTGRYIEPEKDGSYKVKSLVDGSETKVLPEDMPPEKALQLMADYIGMGPDELIKHGLTAEQYRQQRNFEIMSKAVPWEGKNGQLIYRVPAGTTDPVDGSPRGPFFADAYGNEVPGEPKGFKPLDIAGKQAEIGQKRSAAAVNWANADKARQPDVVDPNKLVPGPGGQAGLVTRNQAGEAQYKPVEGGLQMPEPAEKPSDTKARYDLAVKQMKDELEPFVEKGKSMEEVMADVLSDKPSGAGATALNNAMALLEKEKNGETLTPHERSIIPNAVAAIQMFQKLSQERRSKFGLATGQQRQIGNVPPPPPAGFVVRGQ